MSASAKRGGDTRRGSTAGSSSMRAPELARARRHTKHRSKGAALLALATRARCTRGDTTPRMTSNLTDIDDVDGRTARRDRNRVAVLASVLRSEEHTSELQSL